MDPFPTFNTQLKLPLLASHKYHMDHSRHRLHHFFPTNPLNCPFHQVSFSFSSFIIISMCSFQTFPLSFSLKLSLPSLPLMHLPPSTSFPSFFIDFTRLNTLFGCSLSPLSSRLAASIVFATTFFARFFMF